MTPQVAVSALAWFHKEWTGFVLVLGMMSNVKPVKRMTERVTSFARELYVVVGPSTD